MNLVDIKYISFKNIINKRSVQQSISNVIDSKINHTHSTLETTIDSKTSNVIECKINDTHSTLKSNIVDSKVNYIDSKINHTHSTLKSNIDSKINDINTPIVKSFTLSNFNEQSIRIVYNNNNKNHTTTSTTPKNDQQIESQQLLSKINKVDISLTDIRFSINNIILKEHDNEQQQQEQLHYKNIRYKYTLLLLINYCLQKRNMISFHNNYTIKENLLTIMNIFSSSSNTNDNDFNDNNYLVIQDLLIQNDNGFPNYPIKDVEHFFYL